MVGRYNPCASVQARARRELKFLRNPFLAVSFATSAARIEGRIPALEDCFWPAARSRALRVRHQEQRQRGPQGLLRCHAPEVECIGKGKAPGRPTSSACKVLDCHPPVTAAQGRAVRAALQGSARQPV